jgi:hypothetical protein
MRYNLAIKSLNALLANLSLRESRTPSQAATTHKSVITIKTRNRIRLYIAVRLKEKLSIGFRSGMKL